MPSTLPIGVQSETLGKNEDPKTTREQGAQPPPATGPYMPHQTWAYLQYLLPLITIFALPLIFAIYVSAKGPVPAHQKLAKFATAHPQVKGQIVAILATSLTIITRWLLGGAAALLARKRLLKPRPVYEVNIFFSLRNTSVIWDWKHRRRMVFLTWFIVAVCGLMTSGFFTLLNPLPIEVHINHSPAREINFAAESDRWGELYRNMKLPLSGSLGTSNETVHVSDVPGLLQSTARKYLASKNQSDAYSVGGIVATLSEFGYTSFVGGTAGALVSKGYQRHGLPAFPLGRPESSSYRLDLQGTWIDVSCQNATGVPFNVAFDRNQSEAPFGAEIHYNFTCPGSSILEKGVARVGEGMLLAFGCPMENSTTIFFRNLGGKSISMGEGGVACKVVPQIGDVNAVLDPDIQAFNITRKSSPTPPLSSTARNHTDSILELLTLHFKYTPVLLHARQALDLLSGVMESFEDSVFFELLEMLLSALFEFEASNRRYMIMRYSENLFPELLREVRVVLNERTIGWEVKWTTWLGLVPFTTVCVIAFVMIAMAFLAEGKLTAFDPMSPVSLLGAASAGVGNVAVPKPISDEVVAPKQESGKTIGHPLDEEVLTLNVSYEKKNGTWGLWSARGGGESTVKEYV